MAIKTKKTWKVLEQSKSGNGIGLVKASFTESSGGARAAEKACTALAEINPRTRYYVAVFTMGAYNPSVPGKPKPVSTVRF